MWRIRSLYYEGKIESAKLQMDTLMINMNDPDTTLFHEPFSRKMEDCMESKCICTKIKYSEQAFINLDILDPQILNAHFGNLWFIMGGKRDIITNQKSIKDNKISSLGCENNVKNSLNPNEPVNVMTDKENHIHLRFAY